MTSNSTKKTLVKPKHVCEFCDREFVREKSFLAHICEYKFRWQDRDSRVNQLGFQCWLDFYKRNSTPKTRTYMDFIHSPYYTAFVKFGKYCVDVKVINVLQYCQWLLNSKTSIDQWAQDTKYDQFLLEYLRDENHLDAISRSIQTTIDLSETYGILPKDVLRWGNSNKICHEITKGKISAWMLYQCGSGIEFMEKLNDSQNKLIFSYINPENWAIKFHRYPEHAKEVKSLLDQGGY